MLIYPTAHLSHGELQTGDGEQARLDGVAYGAAGDSGGVCEVRHGSADDDGEDVHGHEERGQGGFAREDGHPGDPEQRASEIQQSDERVVEASVDVFELRQSQQLDIVPGALVGVVRSDLVDHVFVVCVIHACMEHVRVPVQGGSHAPGIEA